MAGEAVVRTVRRMPAITIDHLTKRFGDLTAVDDLSFDIEPGTITGFLGRNGAGKSTTLRVLMGLSAPTAGSATFDGRRLVDVAEPARLVGAVIDPSFHPGRRGRDHLLATATAVGVEARRVDEVLETVGLGHAGQRRVGGYSTGMRQRLSLAAALLGDPAVLVLDEPTNGLDPDGVRWLRGLLRSFRDEGRTVLVSSHLLAEVAQSVDDVVIIDQGRLVRHESIHDLPRTDAVLVRTPDVAAVVAAVDRAGLTGSITEAGDGVEIRGAAPESVARVVADAGALVFELRPVERSLEDVFVALTGPQERSAR